MNIVEEQLTDASGAKMINVMVCEDGMILPKFLSGVEETMKNMENISDLSIRNDDILLHTYPKSGTHWGFEIISMLLQGSAERKPDHKIDLMLERVLTKEIDAMTSPRILNTHLPLRFLPKQLKEKKTKILLIMRNPKDVIVSMYHMLKGMKRNDYDGKFSDYFVNFINGKGLLYRTSDEEGYMQVPYGCWFDHILEWENAIDTKEYDVHITFFEDLKEDGVEEIKKIALFLGTNADDELCEAICEACSFEKMKVEKAHPKELAEKMFRPGFEIFRKGQIGDWKNHFTVAENEQFDKLFEEKLADSKLKTRLKFEYSNK